MIVKMQKITLVTISSEKEKALRNLRKIGVMHLNFGDGKNTGLEELLSQRSNVDRALRSISDAVEDGEALNVGVDDAVDRILRIEEEKRALVDELDLVMREKERIEPWGDFEPGDVAFIRDKGIRVFLYTLTADKFKEVKDRKDIYVIDRDKTAVRVAAVNGEIEDAVATPVPERSLSSINGRLSEIEQTIKDLDLELLSFGPQKGALEARVKELDESIEFEQAMLLMNEEEELSYISGFVPEPKVVSIKNAAKNNSWALLVQEPGEEENVPILLKNKKPVRIISPMFDLLGALPGYREYDISLWFLLFFSLFFAMIIGDAGYGFVFLGVTLSVVIMRKSKGKPAGLELILLTVLSVATIVWGTLTGTWFGSKVIADAPPFKYLVVESISSFNPKSGDTIKYFCFIIGTVQIALAHCWNFITQIRKKPRIKALAQLGWMVIVLGVFYFVLNLVLDPIKYPIPNFALYMVAGGLGFVILFSEQEGNFLKGILKGLTGLFQTFLDGISAFADVISYIRLFAVGLATVEIAKSFNAMASDMGSSIVGIIGSILVLAIGHGINIAMGALSVIVHGVRLNMLEFSSHLSMEWSGMRYNPFTIKTSTEPEIELRKE